MHTLFLGLLTVLAAGTIMWAVSVKKEDASVVDNVWGLFFAILMGVYTYPICAVGAPMPLPTLLMAAALGTWVARYSIYIYLRNHNQPEDQRYTDIRENWNPGFWWKSLFIIFLFQPLIAWILSGPFFMVSQVIEQPYYIALSYVGCAIAFFGIVFEATADYQLNKFKKTAQENNTQGEVMDKGLWRYSRHPNYFGQSTMWVGFAFITIGYTGAWWVLYAPALMTFLLLKFSGVSLMESTIVNRRPAYKDYMERTSAFIPWFPKEK